MINKINGEAHVNKIIGMTESEAIEQLAKLGKKLRVISREGVPLMIKGMDVDMSRVNVFMYSGVVSNIDKIG